MRILCCAVVLSVLAGACTAANVTCTDVTTQKECLSDTEDGTPCYWCTSRAVKSSCFNEEQAKKLPPAVFNCSAAAQTETPVSPPTYDSTSECDACFLLVRQIKRLLRPSAMSAVNIQRWIENHACSKLDVLALDTCDALVDQHGKTLGQLFLSGNFNEENVCEKTLRVCNA